jgi:hypothetical protein
MKSGGCIFRRRSWDECMSEFYILGTCRPHK